MITEEFRLGFYYCAYILTSVLNKIYYGVGIKSEGHCARQRNSK